METMSRSKGGPRKAPLLRRTRAERIAEVLRLVEATRARLEARKSKQLELFG